jgi:hypothetical protein
MVRRRKEKKSCTKYFADQMSIILCFVGLVTDWLEVDAKIENVLSKNQSSGNGEKKSKKCGNKKSVCRHRNRSGIAEFSRKSVGKGFLCSAERQSRQPQLRTILWLDCETRAVTLFGGHTIVMTCGESDPNIDFQHVRRCLSTANFTLHEAIKGIP